MFLQVKRRQRLLAQIRDTWLKGVLEPSIDENPSISLSLLSWTVDDAQTPLRCLPVIGSQLIDVYDASRNSLVIIGDEGSGKTTVLLELLRDLWQRAQQDTQMPIPIMFHLSSWAKKCEPLEKWLAEEWKVLYPTGEFKAGEFLLILDGFDTICEELQDVCFNAINTYQEMHRNISLVFCCRNTDYEHIQLSLSTQPHSVVQIQPLTDEQIDVYIYHARCDQAAMKRALESDPSLYALVHRPLPLVMLSQLYQGSMEPDIRGGDQAELLQNLVAIYVQSQLEPQRRDKMQTNLDASRWLSWLASHLWQDQIIGIHLEHLLPRWLPSTRWLVWYRLLVSLMTLFAGLFMLTDLLKGWNLFVLCMWLFIVVILFFRRPLIGVDSEKSFLRLNWLWLVIGKIGALTLVLHISNSWIWILLYLLALFVLAYVVDTINGFLDKYILPACDWVTQAGRRATIAGLFIVILLGAYEVISLGVIGVYQGLYPGIFVGLCFWLSMGGGSFLEYWLLHFCFWRSGCFPWRYRAFLDVQVKRKLLFRIGYGYLFRHQMFIRYFALLQAKAVD
ncbi:NACHT domain-containing protein [Dictyobacter vulcani]|uniref:NACHT domain-containing protein n=1 Tax=Dictyobacter vulcani TaxID=2607529 RepID=UPI00124FFA32|nr:NACHT domain-containing protein [Dictyobacter vulcani]